MDEGDCPPDGNADLNISSSEEEINVDESNDSNNKFPDDLLNVLYGESPPCHGGVQHGQQHQEERDGVEDNELYDKSLHDDNVEDESDRDKSGGLDERKDSNEDDEVDMLLSIRHGKTGEVPLTKSQRKRLRKKERMREKRDRDQEEDQMGDHESHRKEEDSAEEVDKRRQKKKKRKKESSGGI